MDKRQQKTRQAMYKAFNTLLETKSYNNITIKEIIKEANIGRSTFYTHFKTKDELLDTMCNDVFYYVFTNDNINEENDSYSKYNSDLENEIIYIFNRLKESQQYIIGILKCESNEKFLQHIKQQLTELFSSYMSNHFYLASQEFFLNHLVCSLVETLKWWILKHPELSSEEVVSYFFVVMPDYLLK